MKLFYYTLAGLALAVAICDAKASHKVTCTEETMRVDIALPSSNVSDDRVYLEGMKGYPNPLCRPKIAENLASFELSLKNIYDCGVTRVINHLTGNKVFYHRIIVEGEDQNTSSSSSSNKEAVSVKCIVAGSPEFNVSHSVVKRDILPAGFAETEDFNEKEIITNAPEPKLSMAIRLGDKLVSGDLNVSPGAHLQMEIALDEKSAPIYGLGVNYMLVTDTKNQAETIIFNGCSVDPFLFENFNTVEGDVLAAKFRAFKFPDSTYVQFQSTVNVCVDRCKGVICTNGQTAFGRRKRREINQSPADPNKVYEVTMTTFIKVNYDENADQNAVSEIDQKIRQLKLTNQKLARNSRAGNVFESIHEAPRPQNGAGPQTETTITPAVVAPSADNEDAKVEETIVFREVITRKEASYDSDDDVASGSEPSFRRRMSFSLLAVLAAVVLRHFRH
uniref:Putative secreted protein n=2 Tax=Anopheles marajoara TaxID=58244 RepID=A0A2M4BN02_9DIPT